jgi:hypothetical protein
MEWQQPFVIYRITAEGKLEAVHWAADIKSAKYWLTYIAQPGDVLCKTPTHPKHTKAKDCAEYWSHKEQSGSPKSDETAWKKWAKERNCSGDLG